MGGVWVNKELNTFFPKLSNVAEMVFKKIRLVGVSDQGFQQAVEEALLQAPRP